MNNLPSKQKNICPKCRENRILIRHHISYHPERTIMICRQCHDKIHRNIREEGKCICSPGKIADMSRKAYYNTEEYKNHHKTPEALEQKKKYSKKNIVRKILSSELMMPYIRLREVVRYNINTGKISISGYFDANHGKKILYLEGKE